MDQDEPDLDAAILSAIDSFRDDQDELWKSDDDGRRALRIVDRLAELVHSTSEHLVPLDDNWGPDWWSTVRELVDNEGFTAAVRERLQISLAWKIAPRTGEMADRCIDVTRVIMRSEARRARSEVRSSTDVMLPLLSALSKMHTSDATSLCRPAERASLPSAS